MFRVMTQREFERKISEARDDGYWEASRDLLTALRVQPMTGAQREGVQHAVWLLKSGRHSNT